MKKVTYKTIDEYIAIFPEKTQTILEELRSIIRKTVPDATEVISYQMPAFRLNNRNFIFFGGYKDHTSLYPATRGFEGFEELENYKGGKGTVQFPLDMKLPHALITRIVKYRAEETER